MTGTGSNNRMMSTAATCTAPSCAAIFNALSSLKQCNMEGAFIFTCLRGHEYAC